MKQVESVWNATVHIGERALKQWWNGMNQREAESDDKTVMKHVESRWINNEKKCLIDKKRLEPCSTRLNHFVSWKTLNQVESGWNSLFHDHETNLETEWNNLFHGNESLSQVDYGYSVSLSWNNLNQDQRNLDNGPYNNVSMQRIYIGVLCH